MQIINMKLSEIHPYEKNPRFNDGAVEAVANAPPHKIQAKIYSERYLVTMDGTVYTMGIKGGLHIHRQKLRPNEHSYLRATINGRNEYFHRIARSISLCAPAVYAGFMRVCAVLKIFLKNLEKSIDKSFSTCYND